LPRGGGEGRGKKGIKEVKSGPLWKPWEGRGEKTGGDVKRNSMPFF